MEDPTADNMPASRCWNEYILLIIMYLRDDVPGLTTPGRVPNENDPAGVEWSIQPLRGCCFFHHATVG